MFLVIAYFCSFLLIDPITDNIWRTRNSQKAKCVLSFVMLSVFFGFRALPILNDTSHYYESQENLILNGDLHEHSFLYYDIFNRFEPGFQFFQRFIALYIWEHPYAIIMISALITSYVIIYVIQKHTNRIGLGVFIFLVFGGGLSLFNVLRQTFAVFIYFAIIYFCHIRKQKYALLLVIPAILFHKYAFILFFPIILSYIKFTKRNIIFCALIAIVAVSFLSPVIELLSLTDTKYIQDERETKSFAVIIGTLLSLMVLYMCSILRKRNDIPRIDDMVAWNCFLSIICGVYCLILPIFARFDLYFKPFITLYFLYYSDNARRKDRFFVSIALVLILLLQLLIMLFLKNEWNHLVPYSLFDFSTKNPETDFGY